jgi:hypothetical protein
MGQDINTSYAYYKEPYSMKAKSYHYFPEINNYNNCYNFHSNIYHPYYLSSLFNKKIIKSVEEPRLSLPYTDLSYAQQVKNL